MYVLFFYIIYGMVLFTKTTRSAMFMPTFELALCLDNVQKNTQVLTFMEFYIYMVFYIFLMSFKLYHIDFFIPKK